MIGSEIVTATTRRVAKALKAMNPIEMIGRLITSKPKKDQNALYEMWRDHLLLDHEDGGPMLEEILRGVFDQEYKRITTPVIARVSIPARDPEVFRKEKAASAARVAAGIAAVRAKHKAIIDHAVQIAMLDWMMPNGKQVRDCTGKEMREMAPRVGAWMTRVASRCKTNQRVGYALTEEELVQIYSNTGS